MNDYKINTRKAVLVLLNQEQQRTRAELSVCKDTTKCSELQVKIQELNKHIQDIKIIKSFDYTPFDTFQFQRAVDFSTYSVKKQILIELNKLPLSELQKAIEIKLKDLDKKSSPAPTKKRCDEISQK